MTAGQTGNSRGDDTPDHERPACRRELLAAEIRAVLRPGMTKRKVTIAAERLLDVAAIEMELRKVQSFSRLVFDIERPDN